MQTCYHECLHYQRNASRQVELDPIDAENQESNEGLPEHLLVELEKEQNVRGAIAEISARCQQMIQMLFFELPPRPYDEIAKKLGLATGSIGFIRGRCLTRLKKHLEKKGF